MSTIFISYARKSTFVAKTICDELKSYNFEVWIDYESIRGGEEWERKLHQGLNSSFALVVLVDNFSIESNWVKKEIELAKSRNMTILPLKMIQFEDLPTAMKKLNLQKIQAIDLSSSQTDTQFLELKKLLQEASGLSWKFKKYVRQLKLHGYGSDHIKEEAIQQLIELGDFRAVPVLIQVLQDEDEWQHIRSSAAFALGEFKDDRALSALQETLAKEINSNFSHNLIEDILGALGKIGGEQALNTLCEFLYIPNYLGSVVLAFEHMKNERIIPHIIKILQLNDEEMKKMIGYSTGYISSSLTPMRKVLIKYLGDLGGNKSVEAICHFLDSDDSEIRSESLHTLGKIGASSVIKQIIEVLKTDENYKVRGLAAKALGQIGDKTAVETLIETLSDVMIMPWVAEALEDLADDRALPKLKETWWLIPEYANKFEKLGFSAMVGYASSAKFAIEQALDSLGADVEALYIEKQAREQSDKNNTD